MRVTRRNVLIVLGILTVAGGTLFGAGAFSTVQADRTVDVSTAGDSGALLGLSDNSSALVSTTGDTLEISNDQLNQNATTIANSSIDVTNNGENDVGLYVNSTHESFDIHYQGSSIEGSAIDVDSGNTESLTLVIDLTGSSTADDLPDGIQFVADTSEHGSA